MVTPQLCWSPCGRMCVFICVCVCVSKCVFEGSPPPFKIWRVCSCARVALGCERSGPPDRLLLPIECAWQVCCGGGLCNVNKQQQQQQQLRWLPPSLSYVVIRSGWKCGTTAPLTINQTFLPGGGLQTETGCGRLSPPPLCVPHVTAPLAADPGPLLCHRPFGSAPQMCDTVTFNRSSDSPFV